MLADFQLQLRATKSRCERKSRCEKEIYTHTIHSRHARSDRFTMLRSFFPSEIRFLNATQWSDFLTARLERPATVAFGRSRTKPLAYEQDAAGVRVRMHRFFEQAPPGIADATARWMRVGRRARRACVALDQWIDQQLLALPPAPPRARELRARGAVHDLQPLATGLFASEFAADFVTQRPRPAITWGRRAKSRARRALLLGSYQPACDVVRVHPVLDHGSVPAWFVRYVLFHEILHAALPHEHHGPGFRDRERAYPDYKAALRWQRQNIDRLIRAARCGAAPAPAARQGFLF